MRSKLLTTSCCGVLLGFVTWSSFSVAQNTSDVDQSHPHVYIGGNTGWYRWEENDFDEDRNLWEAYIGFAFNPYLALEFDYTDLGTIENSVASAEIDGWSPVLVASLPLTSTFDLYGKVGRYYWDADVSALGFSDTLDGDENLYAVGARFNIADPLQLTLEYTRYNVDLEAPSPLDEVDEGKVDAVKAGLSFSF